MQAHLTTPFDPCPICHHPITIPGYQKIGQYTVCESCIANFNLRLVSEQKCLSCGGQILVMGSKEWFCLESDCDVCSPGFDDPRNMGPLVRFFAIIAKKAGNNQEQFMAFISGRAKRCRTNSYPPEEIVHAIELVRKLPQVQHQVAWTALNISRATFYRLLEQKKLKSYIAKEGLVYSHQVVQILDRQLAEQNNKRKV